MSEFVDQETPSATQRSLFGAALGMEYGPCSVPASEAASVAHSLILPKPKYGVDELFIADDQDPSLPKRFAFDWLSPDTVVTRSIEPKPRTTKKHWFSKKHAEQIDHIQDNPMLMLKVIGNSVLLPLVSFESRQDGNCSHVQLGQEMTDDSIYTVRSDDDTERLEIIEDIRFMLTKNSGVDNGALLAFAQKEMQRKNEQVSLAIGGFLAKEFHKAVDYGHRRSCVLINPECKDGDPYHIDYARNSRSDEPDSTGSWKYANNPKYNGLSLVRSDADDQSLVTIGAVSRGNVILPLADFNIQTGECRLHTEEQINSNTKTNTLLALNAVRQNDASFISSDRKEVGVKQFLEVVFDIESTLKERLQPSCENREKLLTALGKKAVGVSYEGIVKDMPIDPTRGDVSGKMVIERDDNEYIAHLSGVPTALRGMPMSKFMTLRYDPTRPMDDKFPVGEDASDFTRFV